MEAFLGYSLPVDVKLLGATLDAWDIGRIEPVAIQCPPKKMELFLRITAENKSSGDYLIIDLGAVPKSRQAIRRAEHALYAKSVTPVGMVGLHGARMCRKGVVTQWPTKQTDTYDLEHQQAYISKGYAVLSWPFHKVE